MQAEVGFCKLCCLRLRAGCLCPRSEVMPDVTRDNLRMWPCDITRAGRSLRLPGGDRAGPAASPPAPAFTRQMWGRVLSFPAKRFPTAPAATIQPRLCLKSAAPSLELSAVLGLNQMVWVSFANTGETHGWPSVCSEQTRPPLLTTTPLRGTCTIAGSGM